MKFGIDEVNGKDYCNNCKKVVASAGELLPDYCSRCGSPLTMQGINEYNKNLFEIKRDLISKLNEIAEENNTDSFNEILKIYLEDLD